jgi:ribosomal protein L31E
MDKKESKKSDEEQEKEYATKIGQLTKAFETEKADKVLLELIEIIPRKTKSEQLKVSQFDI